MSGGKRPKDVAVIGGGVIGLATACQLAREGVSVTVLERGQCGREASWAGAGVLQSGSWHRRDPIAVLLRESVQLYEAFTADLKDRTGVDPEYVRSGSLEVLLADQQYRMAVSEVKAARAYEEQYGRRVLELLTPEQAREREPNLTGELLGAKYCPITAQVRNPRLLKALRAACERKRVSLVEGCTVRGLVRTGERVTGVQTDDGPRPCGQVVLAAGSWSSLIDDLLRSLMPVNPVRGQIVLLSMAERPFAHVLERGRCYLVPRQDARIVVGATQEPEAGYEKRTTAAGIGGLLGLAQRLVPVLGDASIEQTWSGLRPGTPDDRPYIGPVPGFEGLIAATGHFRTGLTLAPITARIVADLIVRGETRHDLSRCRVGREFQARETSRRRSHSQSATGR